MKIHNIFDQESNTFTYIVYDESSKDAVIIDPVLNYNSNASKISTECIDEITEFSNTNGLNIHFSLETHVHADHLSGAYSLKEKFPQIKLGISHRIIDVQNTFKNIFNIKTLSGNGSEFDLLFEDGQTIEAGQLKINCIATPGHTPACTSFLINDSLFTGDALFMPDFGTGRCDFPAGSAGDLYHSISEKLYSLPDETNVYVGHDYGSGGREILNHTTIGLCKKNSIQLKEDTSKEEFVNFRTNRDAQLNAPKLLLQSLQVNLFAGKLPEKEDNGTSYLKIPLNQ